MLIKREIIDSIRADDLDRFRAIVTTADVTTNDGHDGPLGTYLHYCAEKDRPEIANHLIMLGAEVNFSGGTWKTTPLTYAAERGHVEMVKLLRENGAKYDVSRPYTNPMFMAIEEGHIEVVNYLLSAGFDANLVYKMERGRLRNALTVAKEAKQEEIVKILRKHGCHMPVEGIDRPIFEHPMDKWLQPIESTQQIINYMQLRFGSVDELGLQELLPGVDGLSVTINVIRPNEYHPYLVLFTNGMSDLPMTVPAGHEDWRYAELVIHLPADWPHPRDIGPDNPWLWPVQWLRKMAYYPHLNKTWLGTPAAIVSSDEPPKPLGANTEQTCLLMVPDFANLGDPLQRGDGTKVHFFTVVPLHTAERDYELKNGMKAFFEQFIEHKVPMTVDVNRESFC